VDIVDFDDTEEQTEDSDVMNLKKKILKSIAEKEDETRERRFILKSTTNLYLDKFEYLVMTLAIWNAIWTPLTISF